ncbi:hypothetical protein EUTSA_v10009663mg [Eutrema salsugineum]|uniref:Uncharacterized protein n=1 Tax=Eutrema salsugineum TaxID=72664 RepID=V4KUW2_EUTSA|nr:hypothetical protein EUTSA_v10009663mg [Eutrema salsugineum]
MVNDEPLLMKMKVIDRANEEFSDFSLSSPTRKIRHLILFWMHPLKFTPIIEEEETDVAMQETSAEEEHEPAPVNEERAIALFISLHYHQPPSGQLYVDRDLISGFNKPLFAGIRLSPYSQSIGTSQQPRALEIIELDESGEDAVMDDAATVIEEDNRSSGLSFPQKRQQQLQQEVSTNGFGFQQLQKRQQQLQQEVSTNGFGLTIFAAVYCVFVKIMQGPAPHSQLDADLAAGMGMPDNGPKLMMAV